MQRIAPTRGGKLSELKWYEATALAAEIGHFEGMPAEVPVWQLFCDTCAQPTARDFSAHPELVQCEPCADC